MPQIAAGTHRLVLLVGRWAIKLPHPFNGWRMFVTGMLANDQEWRFASTGDPRLCPVRLAIPLGLGLVMPRCEPLADDEWAAFDPVAFCRSQPDTFAVPAEPKPCSFGRLNGRVVAVDFG